jgi:asparagine synthase (glutamine-hydrolysing)
MTASLAHRGPDGDGHWLDPSGIVALGHRRLAIVDLSEGGRQPMVSHGGRFVVTYNGEIYNFLELRRELEAAGCRFTSHSDTEVMLAAFERWGVRASLSRFNGMFALAVWDAQERLLTLARDRLGKKPLYYGRFGRTLLFGSELKALLAVPGFNPTVDRRALTQYMRHNYVPAPASIYREVRKLPAGSTAELDCAGDQLREPVVTSYWDSGRVLLDSRGSRAGISEADALAEFERLMLDAVRIRMIADVPLGAFLSGGLDSSLVVALMQRLSDSPVQTFTIGFHEDGYDEARHAKAVAGHLGTDHVEVYLSGRDALDVIPRLPVIYDEPFADSSQIPTWLVSAVARRQVTVALSGDGGDEGFLGYNRYVWARDLWRRVYALPPGLRRLAARSALGLTAGTWDAIGRPLQWIVPALRGQGAIGDRVHKLAGLLAIEDPRALYLRLISHWQDPAAVVLGGHESETVVARSLPGRDIDEFVEEMARLDVATYLPDDILVKVDRASMSVSLETRAPLLDYRVIEFAASLPYDLRMRGRTGKWLLRRLLYKHVPRAMVDRPKTGFGIPLDKWLRGPLRSWAEDLLSESRLRGDGYFAPEPIRAMWTEHASGARQWQYPLWDVLMFQAWLHSR